MAKNYLPFLRRETVIVPPLLADRVSTGGFAVTDLARMATGGTQKCIVQEIFISPHTYAYSTLNNGLPIRVRIGIDGIGYMTEDLYDYRVYFDKQMPWCAIWDWSCGKKTPYRLYPGQKMTVMMSPSSIWEPRVPNTPIAVMFNAMKVAHGSPVGTKEGEPILLYAPATIVPATSQLTDLIALESPRLYCPKDSPVDIYSVTIPECFAAQTNTQLVYILDGNERPFWDSRVITNTIDIVSSPISFGYGGCQLDPDQTLRLEIENADDTQQSDISVWVTYRGVLEVDDGR